MRSTQGKPEMGPMSQAESPALRQEILELSCLNYRGRRGGSRRPSLTLQERKLSPEWLARKGKSGGPGPDFLPHRSYFSPQQICDTYSERRGGGAGCWLGEGLKASEGPQMVPASTLACS